MRKLHKYLLPLLTIVTLIAAIICSKNIIIGAKEGLSLCVQMIIPSIFPFLFLSMLMCNYSKDLSIPFLTPLCKVTGVPIHTQQILILSLIGGYPIGAQAAIKAKRDKLITKETAQRLLGFCNNAGPAFIFGLLSSVFDHKLATLSLWLIHIGSALIVGSVLPGKRTQARTVMYSEPEKVTDILISALRVTAVICGWVILFRILLALISGWLLTIPTTARVMICGILELSNGCIGLSGIENECIRFVMASVLLSCGGLCVLLQTWSVADEVGLGLYLPGKLLQTLLSILISCMISPILYNVPPHMPIIIAVSLLTLGIVLLFKKKSSSFICANTV